MVKAANFLILLVGIALIILGALAGRVTILIIGDILTVGGILLYWAVKKGMPPPALGGGVAPRDSAGRDANSPRDGGTRKGPDGV